MASGEGGIRLRPMGIGDILDETFRLYRRHFLSFVIAMAVVAVPLALLSAAFNVTIGAVVTPGRDPTLTQGLTIFAAALPLALASGLGYLLSGGAAVRLTSDAALGRPLDVGAAYRDALGRVLPLFGAGFLAAVAVGLLAITCLGLPFAIYLGVGWSLNPQIVVLERAGSGAALRRSAALVKENRWRVFGTIFLISLLVGILVNIPSGIVGLIAGALVAVAEFPGEQYLLQLVNAFMSAVGQSLLGAIFWMTSTLLYFDLRVRKEAFDLEQLTARAEEQPSSPLPPPRLD